MNGYLQRLFDRGAGFAAAPASVPTGDVVPAMVSGSPAVAFDQRLADPELSQVFAVLGVSPDPEALVDGEPTEEAAATLGGVLGVSPDPEALVKSEPADEAAARRVSARTSAPPAAASTALSPERIAGRTVLASAVPRLSVDSAPAAEQAGRHAMEASTRPSRSDGIEALGPQPEARASTAEPHPVRSQPPVAIAHREAGRTPRVQGVVTPVAIALSRRQAEPLRLALPHPPQGRRAFSPKPETVPRPMPSQPMLPTERLPARSPMHEVEPLRPAPPALEPIPAPATDAREVERIVREAVRDELARRLTGRQGADPRRPVAAAAASDRDSVQRPTLRPTSAREASVIGELEPSSVPLTIYGLRRR